MSSPTETLRVTRVIPAKKERVFRAWTNPDEVRRWWTIGEGWKAEFVEMDVRVGGKLRLGNRPRGGDLVLVTGEFLEVRPPDRLVYSWRFLPAAPEVNTITVDFREMGEKTEVTITHANSSREMAAGARDGWAYALSSLSTFLGVTGPPFGRKSK